MDIYVAIQELELELPVCATNRLFEESVFHNYILVPSSYIMSKKTDKVWLHFFMIKFYISQTYVSK